MKLFQAAIGLALMTFVVTGCETLQNLPTNTTGNVFSLNGQWRLTSTTDNNALVGTVIQVYPIVGNATVKSTENNTYCVRNSDELWRAVKRNDAGGFTISSLVTACNGSAVYNAGTISVANNDEIVVTTRTSGNSELVQRWSRVKAG